MALVIYWYDFICFGIVIGSFILSLWVIWRRELSKRRENAAIYESLLPASRLDSDDGFIDSLPKNHLGTAQLWTSCWKGVHPGWLLAVRFCSFLIMAGFLSWDITKWSGSVFVYYTEWTFTLVMVYFALGTIVSGYGCWMTSMLPPPTENGETTVSLSRDVEDVTATTNSVTYKAKTARNGVKVKSHHTQETILLRAGFWGYLMQTVFQACAGAVVLTDVVFWCVIVPFLSNAHVGLNLLMGFMHTLNALFLLLDTSLNSLPFPWFRIAYFVQWTCIYVIFQWVIHACGLSWWPYPFVELDSPWAPLWYFCIAVLHIPCYGLFLLIVKAKNTYLPKLCPHSFVRSC